MAVRPVTSTGLASGFTVADSRHGQCEVGTDLASAGDLYRCFTRTPTHTKVLDPCWRDPRFRDRLHVVCLPRPWQTDLVPLALRRHPYGGISKPEDVRFAYPWAVELTSGDRCLAEQGAHDAYKGRVVDYLCAGMRIALLRGLHREGSLWTADSVIHDQSRPYYRSGPLVSITTAWYADGHG